MRWKVLETNTNCPNHRSPGCGEAENKEASEADHSGGCALGILRHFAVKRKVAHGSEDQEADEHPNRACNKRLAAAVMLDNVKSVKGDAEVDSVLRTCQLLSLSSYV